MARKKKRIKTNIDYSIRQAMIRGQEMLKQCKNLKPEIRAYIQYVVETLKNIDQLI